MDLCARGTRRPMHYYAVPMNAVSVSHFRMALGRIWWRVLNGAVRKSSALARMERQVARWLPHTRICHPYPWYALAYY